MGLSPRGRGKPSRAAVGAAHIRSIPAWAGETDSLCRERRRLEVYPRVGGGNSIASCIANLSRGLSPRGRGKRLCACRLQLCLGSIPAWAGETHRNTNASSAATVYPRVGGGNESTLYKAIQGYGLSPRGRGKRVLSADMRKRWGSIPAWAGETSCSRGRFWQQKVYPRVGGGNHRRGRHIRRHGGLSPRGRGKRSEWGGVRAYLWSIPAWAGETHGAGVGGHMDEVYPRVGGGNAQRQGYVRARRGLSPRGRGKPQLCAACGDGARSIPAWAGETLPIQFL